MKVKDLIPVYNMLAKASLSKVEEKDQFSIVKLLIALKPEAEKYEGDRKTAEQSLRGEQHDEMLQLAQKCEQDNQSASKADVSEVNAYFESYYKKLNAFVEEYTNKDSSSEYTKISEEAYIKLCASNPNLTVEQRALLFEHLV